MQEQAEFPFDWHCLVAVMSIDRVKIHMVIGDDDNAQIISYIYSRSIMYTWLTVC